MIRAEEAHDLLVSLPGIAAAELDELTRERTVEEQIGEQIGFVGGLALGQASRAQLNDPPPAAPKPAGADIGGAELAEILRRLKVKQRNREDRCGPFRRQLSVEPGRKRPNCRRRRRAPD